jgi:hypothetical protein
MSNSIMAILLVEYVALIVMAGVERRWWLASYWLGASILTLGVLKGMK